MRSKVPVWCVTSLILVLAACGSESDSGVDAAYESLHDAGAVFDCSTAYGDMSSANVAHDVAGVHQAAASYRDLLSRWATAVKAIDFPLDARSTVDEILATTDREIADLDAVAATVTAEDTDSMVRMVFYDDWASLVTMDRLDATLGHAPAKPLVAADHLELARVTYQKDAAWVRQLFDAAVTAGDLAAAKAANGIEERALQKYSDALGRIDWPDGVSDKVADLKVTIQALIDFDVRQTDVAEAGSIVPAPPGGSPEATAERDTETALVTTLQDMEPPTDGPPTCP